MSQDWLTDGEEFADRMMHKIEQSVRIGGDGVEIEISEEMIAEVLDEMGVCEFCGLKREHRAGCPALQPGDTR